MKQTEILTHATHVNGWFPAVYMSCMSQNFRLFHVSNLSVRNFRIFCSSSLQLPSAGRVSLRSGAADPVRRWPLGLLFFCCARWWRRAADASRGDCLYSVRGSVWPGVVGLIRWTHLLCLRAVMVITGCDPPRSLAPATVSVMSRMIGRDTGAGAGGQSGGWRPLLWTAATAVAA